jgi:hypothetical protein
LAGNYKLGMNEWAKNTGKKLASWIFFDDINDDFGWNGFSLLHNIIISFA